MITCLDIYCGMHCSMMYLSSYFVWSSLCIHTTDITTDLCVTHTIECAGQSLPKNRGTSQFHVILNLSQLFLARCWEKSGINSKATVWQCVVTTIRKYIQNAVEFNVKAISNKHDWLIDWVTLTMRIFKSEAMIFSWKRMGCSLQVSRETLCLVEEF